MIENKLNSKEKEMLLGLVIQALENIGLGEIEYLKPLQTIEQKLTEETTPVHKEQCWNCKEDIEYTEIHSFCPECLTHL